MIIKDPAVDRAETRATPERSMTAVAWAAGEPCEMVPARIAAPRSDEVLVRIHGVGICHSDIIALNGFMPTPFPAVFGHEGAGVVEAVGADVKDVAPGDRVVVTFRSCGACERCDAGHPAYCARFVELNLLGRRGDTCCAIQAHGQELTSSFFGQSSFGEFALTYERNLVKVGSASPLALLGSLGCSIQTGAGSVMRAFACPAGSSIAITGAGAVGLSAVLGAVVQGCATIIVSEPDPLRRAMALDLGATRALDPHEDDLATVAKALVPGGVDYALDTSGVEPAIQAAASALRSQGMLGLLGIPPDRATPVPCDMMSIITRGLTVRGIVEGDSDPQAFIPELVELHRQGRFPFDRFVQTYALDDINTAVSDLKEGRSIKAVLTTAAADQAPEMS